MVGYAVEDSVLCLVKTQNYQNAGVYLEIGSFSLIQENWLDL